MKLETKYHGILNYEEDDIITFAKGLPGLQDLKKFILVDFEENPIFKILHSVEDEEVGLVTVSPFDFINEYEFELKDSIVERLTIKDSNEILVLNTVTLSSKVENITTNLKAPIIINTKSKLGEQIIIDNEKYMIKHPLLRSE
ncbi:flagellar assembly protein FliW [Clostridium folliculivorans]|uniref:Flagellar assembly factor FliW n=1 Tax=Clostridium folliculivorans TaxID=2886038 RepID=A0A9W5XZ22_9CLOT|nr:flagellar assembly protein FliW [Clostridium folliculivorans]GKU23555.1 flagellar assembly factor FliW [Clostridium folliculivorans]GKU29671.1 flagellar assembly factor FliW [Clostridium folliculivorans]